MKTIDDLDTHMRDWFARLQQTKVDDRPKYEPTKVQVTTSEFKGPNVKEAVKRFQTLGGTNSNTNEDNRNV